MRNTNRENYERALRDFESKVRQRPPTRKAHDRRQKPPREPPPATGSSVLIQRLRGGENRPDAWCCNSTLTAPGCLRWRSRRRPPLRARAPQHRGRVRQRVQRRQLPVSQARISTTFSSSPAARHAAPTRSLFVLRANGSVISARLGTAAGSAAARWPASAHQPGDAVFVPEVSKTCFVQNARNGPDPGAVRPGRGGHQDADDGSHDRQDVRVRAGVIVPTTCQH